MFDEIVPQYAIQLMQDVFGNYVRLFLTCFELGVIDLVVSGVHVCRWSRKCSSMARRRRRHVSLARWKARFSASRCRCTVAEWFRRYVDGCDLLITG